MERFENKVVIITGGSRGIGKAIADTFVGEGAKVVIASKTVEESTEKDIMKISVDVSVYQDVKRMVDIVVNHFDTVDILVNCAAIQKPIGPFLDADIEQWIKNIHVNLIGTVLCCKAVLPIMVRNGEGHIVNFSGGGAVDHRTNFSAYAVSKAAVVRFTETLTTELKGYDINVNAVAPGVIRTTMIEEAIRAGEDVHLTVGPGEGNLKDVSELVLFLSSEKSKGITGRLISAVWDDWRNLTNLDDSSLYTLRRIDKWNFVEIKL